MRLSDIGEYKLIERIKRIVGVNEDENLIKGMGEDAAIIRTTDKLLLITTDILVEGVHFDTNFIKPYYIGWKATCVAMSDIVAMGGIPKYLLFSISLPGHLDNIFIDELYKGIKELADKFGTKIIGGDLSESFHIVIAAVGIGEVEDDNYITREGMQVGDNIYISGTVGDSACGLKLLKDKKTLLKMPTEIAKFLINQHLQPTPKVNEIIKIKQIFKPTSMIDVSDGLVNDLFQLVKASGKGVEIYLDKLPISKEVKLAAKKLNISHSELALYGGEDYELLFTAKNKTTQEGITLIGKVVSDTATVIGIDKKKRIELERKGWEHFKKY